jgi:AcrR family transcriptional regulator
MAEATSAPNRVLAGDKAHRMRESVAEVGVAGSTFERVSEKAGVSRGLLHYYFGSKERLLVEVIRRDTQFRVETLGDALRAARSVDDVIAAFFTTFRETIRSTPGYVYMVSELFVAGRNNQEILSELGNLYGTARAAFAKILEEKEREGVVRLRYPAQDVLGYLFAAGDGGSVQRLAQPNVEFSGADLVAVDIARYLLWAGE